jgi:hypothetical protein
VVPKTQGARADTGGYEALAGKKRVSKIRGHVGMRRARAMRPVPLPFSRGPYLPPEGVIASGLAAPKMTRA